MKLSLFRRPIESRANPVKNVVWYLTSLVFFQSSLFPFYNLKASILRGFGAKIGKGVKIKPNVLIKNPWNLEVGNHCWIGQNVWLENIAQISIGNNVCISQGAFLVSGSHDHFKESFDLIEKPIRIEDDVWICAKTLVAPGVVCGKGAVLALGAVALNNLEADTIYQGNPAESIRKRVEK